MITRPIQNTLLFMLLSDSDLQYKEHRHRCKKKIIMPSSQSNEPHFMIKYSAILETHAE